MVLNATFTALVAYLEAQAKPIEYFNKKLLHGHPKKMKQDLQQYFNVLFCQSLLPLLLLARKKLSSSDSGHRIVVQRTI